MRNDLSFFQRPLPLVPLLCTASGAEWKGKWHLNTSTDSVRALGGPWNTQQEAVDAVLATGQWRLRPGMAADNPHLERV